jgi:hypothetical protein
MATGEEGRHPCHERLRDALPAVEYGTCAGVRVPRPAEPRKPFDRLFGRDTPDHSTFEGGLASVHRDHTRPGEDVTVVGGGFGITTVAAAETGARVTVYEASADRLAALRETLRLNGVGPDRVTLRQTVVGTLADAEAEAKGLDPNAAPTVPPADLLPCDVLELDCEGPSWRSSVACERPRPTPHSRGSSPPRCTRPSSARTPGRCWSCSPDSASSRPRG